MTLGFDPQVAQAMAPLMAMAAGAAPPPAGDVTSRRAVFEALFDKLLSGLPEVTRVDVARHELTRDGETVALRWYAPAAGASLGSAMLYVHGGGMILGSLDMYDRIIQSIVAASGVPALAVEYRLAPEHPHPVPVEDCYAALVWLGEHAAELGVDPARIAVMGDSAGGGLAAGVALLAAERGGPALADQILIYPMLDDRNTVPDERLQPFLTWTYDDNVTGWGALLGDAAGGDDVPESAAPARAVELAGLPPAYIEVGELDIFRDEDIDYARRLSAAGVSVELHVRPGCPHGFEVFGAGADVADRAMVDRVNRLARL